MEQEPTIRLFDTEFRQRNSILPLLKIKSIWWMLFDASIAILSIKLAYLHAPKVVIYNLIPLQLWIFPLVAIIAGNITCLYDKNIFTNLPKLIIAVTLMVLLSILGLSLFTSIFLYEKISRYVLLTNFGIFLSASGGVRILCYFMLRQAKMNVLFVGDQNTIVRFMNRIKSIVSHYKLVGFAGNDVNTDDGYLGGIQEIPQICSKHKIGLVVVDNDYVQNPNVLDKCLSTAWLNCDFVDAETFSEQVFEQVLIDKIDPAWFYRARLGIHNNFQVALKRLLDIVVAVVGLIIIVLVLPLVWILNYLFSSGPIFYSQMRCGQFTRFFKLYKFRTMQLESENTGSKWTQKRDPRITFVGKLLRKLRFDELPQCWNVLKGDMSLVGPRPEWLDLVKLYEKQIPYYHFRHWVKPGITGFAQIRYKYGASVEDAKEKLAYDLYYIKNWSILMDLQIILRTISALMKGSR